MHLYKRGRVWWIEYIVGGERHRESTHTRKKDVAESWMKAIKTSRSMPTFEQAVEVLRMLYKLPPEGMIALDAAWDKYLEIAKALGKLNVSAKTLDDRRRAFLGFRRWMSEQAATISTVEGVSGTIAAKYAQHLATGGRKSKTRQNIIRQLFTMWTLLEKVSGGVRNPWRNLAPADTDSERIPPFSHEQEEKVLEAARKVGKDWEPVCVVARHTGLRYGDIANMTWDEVDFETGIIRKRPRKTKRFGVSVALPLIEPIRRALEGLPRRGPYIFPLHADCYGKRGRNVQALLNFREVLDEAGLDEADGHTFHSWRHSAATRLAEAGADKETRKMILGHTTDANAERYDHAEHMAEMKAAMERAAKG